MIQQPSKLFILKLIKFESEGVSFFEDAIDKLFITDRGPQDYSPQSSPLIRFWLQCSFKYRYIVYCCGIVLIKLVSDFHSFCSSILTRDVRGVTLRCLLDYRPVSGQLQNMIYSKTALLTDGPRWSFRGSRMFCHK